MLLMYILKLIAASQTGILYIDVLIRSRVVTLITSLVHKCIPLIFSMCLGYINGPFRHNVI